MPAHECPDFSAILRQGAPTDALRELVARCYRAELIHVATSMCGDSVVGEDVAHDALLNGLEVLHTYRGDAPLLAWLRRLVRTACNRSRRGRKNDPTRHQDLVDAPLDATSVPPVQEVRALANERVGQLLVALDKVDEPNRSLLLLHEGMDQPLAELARQFGLTTDAVKGRLRRTRRQLREELSRVHRSHTPAPPTPRPSL